MAAESVRKVKDTSGWVELLAWEDGEKMLGQARGSSSLRGLEVNSIWEQTDTRQGGNWKKSLIRHSRLLRRDHCDFNCGQRDGLAQEHFFKDQKTSVLLYNIYHPQKSSVFLLPQNCSVNGSGRKICQHQG